MDDERFRNWFSHLDELAAAQRKKVTEAPSGRPEGRLLWRRSNWVWMTSGAVCIAAVAVRRRGASRGAKRVVCAAIGAMPAGRHSAPSPARRCRVCVVRSAGWPSARRLAKAGRSVRLPSAAGLRPARRFVGAAAFWRRFGRRRIGLSGSSRPMRRSFSRAERGSGSWTASRAGAAARLANVAFRAQAPVLVAPGRAGATLDHTLPALNAESVKEVLEPVVARDALLVSDASRRYRPVAAALDIPHESIDDDVGERVCGALHIQMVNRRQVSRRLSQVVPSHHARRAAIAESLSRGGDDQAMPANRESSLLYYALKRLDLGTDPRGAAADGPENYPSEQRCYRWV